MFGAGGGFHSPVGSASAAIQCMVLMDDNSGAYACATSEDGDELKAFADKKDAQPNQFDYSVGKNDDSVKDIQVNTIQNVDVDSGYGEIKPAKNNTLTDIVFTPTPSTLMTYDGMFFRGQFEDIKGGTSFDGNLFADVTSTMGVTQFEWTGLPTNANHVFLGFDEPAGMTGLAFLSVELFVQNGDMKSIKQVDFSVPGAVPPIPEPSTWAMMIIGFAGLGYAGFRKAKSRVVVA
jgi:hypothetical protein